MKHTSSSLAALSPAKQAAPKPGTGSATTRAPSDAASSPEPSVEPLSTTIGSVAGGHPLEHPRQGLAFVQDRQDHVGHGPDASLPRR